MSPLEIAGGVLSVWEGYKLLKSKAPWLGNAAQAVKQLCYAGVTNATVRFETATKEREALIAARISALEEGGRQFTSLLKDNPEYVLNVMGRQFFKEAAEQKRLDDIALEAMVILQQTGGDSDTAAEAPPISEDWLCKFGEPARQAETAEMKKLFARMLAGEIRKPSSFSPLAIRILGDFDTGIAKLFSNAASMVTHGYVDYDLCDSRIICHRHQTAYTVLRDFGVDFDHVMLLVEYGLFNAEIDTHADYKPLIIGNEGAIEPIISYAGKYWRLEQDGGIKDDYMIMHGFSMTRAGAQLTEIVDKTIQPKYDDYLLGLIRNNKLKRVEVVV